MERNNIGTDASIATHIENIGKRKYVRVGGGRCATHIPLSHAPKPLVDADEDICSTV